MEKSKRVDRSKLSKRQIPSAGTFYGTANEGYVLIHSGDPRGVSTTLTDRSGIQLNHLLRDTAEDLMQCHS
ncbi:hypothetical protein HZH66_004147 [Vespula vulgaris]|uniref:Uncharacterized protein n=1 Tax=Vespula vulgaris TaxID=7454 RepID=A0A834KJK5_VESVU|nr:hypothetical protein HZH66_004147 [Vespula vulgaris]